ncbi:hypothetical protein Q9233_016230, partial [Columba guinea]
VAVPSVTARCDRHGVTARCARPRRRSVQRLLPFTQYGDSAVHRRGIVGALRNCCFEHEDHEWLLSEEVDILPFLLLPLAGPEELPEDEMEREGASGGGRGCPGAAGRVPPR